MGKERNDAHVGLIEWYNAHMGGRRARSTNNVDGMSRSRAFVGEGRKAQNNAHVSGMRRDGCHIAGKKSANM